MSSFQILQAQTRRSNSLVFDLGTAQYSSDMLLGHIGVVHPDITEGTGVYYPSFLGVMECIDEINLWSGSKRFASYDSNDRMAIVKQLVVSNDYAEDIARVDVQNGQAFGLQGDAYSLQSQTRDFNQRYVDTAAINSAAKFHLNGQSQPSALDNLYSRGCLLRLSDLVPELGQIGVLDFLPNLRLEIKFKASGVLYQDSNRATAIANPDGFTYLAADLYYQRLQESIPKERLGETVTVNQLVHVHDRIEVSAATGATGTIHLTKEDMPSFEDRYVEDLTVFRAPSVDRGFLRAEERSIAPRRGQLQFNINGVDVIPEPELRNNAYDMYRAMSVHGEFNLPLACFMDCINGEQTDGRYLSDAAAADALQVWNIAGNLGVQALKVRDVIRNMLVYDQRETFNTAGDNTDRNQAYSLVLVGRCLRKLIYKIGENDIVEMS